jgi:hypothetical protein
MGHDHASWQIKGEAILGELIELMGISEEDAALLGALKGAAQAAAPQLTQTFYDRLFSHANTAEYLEGASMERLHGMVQGWFVDLFGGKYDEAYARKRLTIGQIHVRIGLPVRYPLAMMDVVLPFGEHVAQQSPEPARALVAFRKALALDVAIFNQAYEDNQLHHLAELVGGERLARRLLAGQG